MDDVLRKVPDPLILRDQSPDSVREYCGRGSSRLCPAAADAKLDGRLDAMVQTRIEERGRLAQEGVRRLLEGL